MTLEGMALESVSLQRVSLAQRMSLAERVAFAERMSPHVKFPSLCLAGDGSGLARTELCQEGRYAGAMNEVTQKGQQEQDMS